MFSVEQEALLIGFASHTRISLKPCNLSSLQLFCESYLKLKPSFATLSRIMNAHDLTSQKALGRTTRLVSEDVVDAALAAIEDIRVYDYPPHRIICMDETGLWSNVTQPKTYHFKNWCEILFLLFSRPFSVFARISQFLAH